MYGLDSVGCCRPDLRLQIEDQGVVLANDIGRLHGKGDDPCSHFKIQLLQGIQLKGIFPAGQTSQKAGQSGILAVTSFGKAGVM